MRQTDGDDWCGWRLAQDWREMVEGGGRSHLAQPLHWRQLNTVPVLDILFHWIGVTIIFKNSHSQHTMSRQIPSNVKKDTFIVGQQSVSKSYLISVDVVTSLFILLMLFLF